MQRFSFVFIFILISVTSFAQPKCGVENKFFDPGEELSYDLYFKYGLIYMKAGHSSLKVENSNYNGSSALKVSLLARSTGNARKFFSLDDTLSCYMSEKLVPFIFEKKAHEGKEHTDETVKYTYDSNGVNIHAKRIRNNIVRFDEKLTTKGCTYDMVSVVYYARTLDYSKMKVGDISKVEFMSGKNKVIMEIEYQGLEKVEASDTRTYNCIKLVLSMNSAAFDDKREAMRVYITNDSNHMPVRLDSKLKVGTTRAILKSYKGNKYTVKTK